MKPSVKIPFVLICFTLLLNSCVKKVLTVAETPIAFSDKIAESNKQTALAFLHQAELIGLNKLTNDFVSSDKNWKGNGEQFLEKRKAKKFKNVEVYRLIEDDNTIVTHSLVVSDSTEVRFDIFEFQQGKLSRHWSNIQNYTGLNPSGHSQVDGATQVKDRERTEANRALVAEFIQTIFIEESGGAGKYFNFREYIQHASVVGDGVWGLMKFLLKMNRQGITIDYIDNQKIIAEGNFVLSYSRGLFNGQPVAYYDLIRVEDGKFAEHWDVVAPIEFPKEWKKNEKYNGIIAKRK